MSQEIVDFLQNFDTGGEIGDIDPVEAWWVERQEALGTRWLHAPTSLPPWLEPSWAGYQQIVLSL